MKHLIKTPELEKLTSKHDINLKYRQLMDIAATGYFPKPNNGDWDEVAVAWGLARYYRRSHNETARAKDDEKKVKTQKEIELLQIKIDEKNKTLVNVADVEHAWSFTCATLKARIVSFDMPAKLKASLLETLEQQPDYDPGKAVENEPIKP